jgi:hypothetical protein
MIAALLPGVGLGNKVPVLLDDGDDPLAAARRAALLAANLNAFAFDFVLRQKLQGQTINLFILEQLPVVAPAAFDAKLGKTTIADFVRGAVRPPFAWDEADRRRRMARLDALFMLLYGEARDDAAYILDTFPQ